MLCNKRMTCPGDANEIISRNANAVVQRTRVAQSWLLIATCRRFAGPPEHRLHQPLLVAKVLGPFIPAGMLPILAKVTRRDDLVSGHGDATVAIRCDIDRIRTTMELAHEAGLTVLHPRQNRRTGLPGIEHVGRTDRDAVAAIRTAVRDDEFDHNAGSS